MIKLASLLTLSMALIASGSLAQEARCRMNGCPTVPSHASVHANCKAFAAMHHAMHIHYTGDIDADFAMAMIPHHQGAVDMANVVLEHGDDENVRDLAEWIAYIQPIEMAHMRHWLFVRGYHNNTGHGAPEAGSRADWSRELYAPSMSTMHREMDITFSGDADYDFVRGMIPHHQGAIDMALVELQYGNNPAMRELARNIITAQQSEIARMQRWLSRYKAQNE